MALKQFCYGISNSTGKRTFAGNEPVVKIIVLGGVENPHEQMVLQTLSGRVLLRSLDGRKSSRSKPDIFVDPDSDSGPVVINASR